ncbi:hypothetical protein KJ918_04095 [Patescibacteria group bacterium]|nr:hypothetical protein [Patescibacteria group bacterium]
MKKLLANLKLTKREFNEKGQILLFVIIILGILLFILLAILVTVRTDIKETALEREYEQGYSVAEEELFKIGADGLAAWKDDANETQLLPGMEFFQFCEGADECYLECGLGDGGNSCVVVKVTNIFNIHGMTINQDETLEVDVEGTTVTLDISWTGDAEAMSVILVCKNNVSNTYPSKRAAVCQPVTAAGNCGLPGTIDGFITVAQAQGSLPGENDWPLNLKGIHGCSSDDPQILRLRAIGGEAIGVSVYTEGGGNLANPQMVEVRVQAFPEGGTATEDISAPEVYTLSMLNKRLPSLFDYVLFVANDSVTKP